MENKNMIYLAVGIVVIGVIGFAFYKIVKKPKNEENTK